MKLIQPVGNGLKETRKESIRGVSASASRMEDGEEDGGAGTHFAIPAKGQVLGVVNDLVLFIFTLALTDLLFLLLFSLFSCPGLLALDIFMSEMSLFLSQVH